MKKILILGGTGFVGRHVCAKLADLDCHITVPTRRYASGRSVMTLPRVDVLEGDVHDPAQLAAWVAGHDMVVNLVAILHGDAAQFHRAHVALPQKLAQACVAAGVRRVVHVSALGAALDAPSMYQRSKAEGEAIWAQSGLAVSLLRPSVIFGAEDKFLNLFAQLQKLFPVLPLAGGRARFQPVWVEDVAAAVVACLYRPSPPSVVEACGPDVFTLKALVQLAAQYAGINGGQGRPVLDLPPALGRLQARIMEWAPGPTLMSRDNLDAMQVDNVASGKVPGLASLDITPAKLASIAPGYLSQASPEAQLDQLRNRATVP